MGLSFENAEHILTKLQGKKRQEHTSRVIKEANNLAMHYNIDPAKIKYAALCHDIAKEHTPETLKEITFTTEEKLLYTQYPKIWHALIGPKIVTQLLQVTDPYILEPIKWHSTGKEDMTTNDMIIFVADYIEPKRQLKNRSYIKSLAYKNLFQATWAITYLNLNYLLVNNSAIYPMTLSCYNNLRKKINPEKRRDIINRCLL